MLIIMLHGNPLSGKSTVAARIAAHLSSIDYPAEVLKSAKARVKDPDWQFDIDDIDESVPETRSSKDQSYRDIITSAESKLNRAIIPILDATFHIAYRRKWVYELAKKRNTPLVIVRVIYSNKNDIQRQLDIRKKKFDPDNMINDYALFEKMVSQSEPLTNAEILDNDFSLLTFDRNKSEISILNWKNDDLLEEVKKCIFTFLPKHQNRG